MKWIEERDALIAQTRAFVEQVAGRTADAARLNRGADRPPPPPPSSSPPPKVARPAAPAAPVKVAEPARPREQSLIPPGFDQVSMSAEIRARIATFRAHQDRFNRERHEYFNATLARLRASIDDLPPPARRQISPAPAARPDAATSATSAPSARRPAAGVPATSRRPPAGTGGAS